MKLFIYIVQKIAGVLMKKNPAILMGFLKVFQVTRKEKEIHKYVSPSQYIVLLSVLKCKGFLF